MRRTSTNHHFLKIKLPGASAQPKAARPEPAEVLDFIEPALRQARGERGFTDDI